MRAIRPASRDTLLGSLAVVLVAASAISVPTEAPQGLFRTPKIPDSLISYKFEMLSVTCGPLQNHKQHETVVLSSTPAGCSPCFRNCTDPGCGRALHIGGMLDLPARGRVAGP